MKFAVAVGTLFGAIIVVGTTTHDIWAYVYGTPKEEQFIWTSNAIMVMVSLGVVWTGQCLLRLMDVERKMEEYWGDVRRVSDRVPTIDSEEC